MNEISDSEIIIQALDAPWPVRQAWAQEILKALRCAAVTSSGGL